MRKDWTYKTLGDIGKVSMCKRVLKNQTTEVGEIPFYKIGTFGKTPDAYISKSLFIELSTKYSFPKKGDILISASGTIGRRVVYDGEPAFFQDSNIVWIANDESQVLNEYLYLFYGYCDWNPSKGATISRLYNDDLRRIPIPIPPIHEQQQIVAILDEAFAAIDQAKANIEKNIQNAKELILSKRNDVFESLSKEIESNPIEDFCEAIFAGGDAPKENFSSNKTEEFPIPIIANAVKDNGLYGYTNEARVHKPSITVAARGSGTGHTEYRDYPFLPIVRLIVLTPDISKIEVEFLMYAIKSLVIERSGSAIPQLTVPMIKSYSIPVPNLVAQIQIVESLSKLDEYISGYILKLERKLLELDELKKSILQKAFAGELKLEKVNAA